MRPADLPMAWVGTSGWSYKHWNGILYPPGTWAKDRLAVYAEQFRTVELNASFYRWPRDTDFANWRDRLPEDFRLTVKASRWLTHGRRLSRPEPWIERIDRAWGALADRAGILLVQLPPDQQRDDVRIESFLKLLATHAPQTPVAIELRHKTWQHDEVFALLQRYSAAYVVMSGAQLPCVLEATAPFVYIRLHGPDDRRLYAGSYSLEDLSWWADRIREWQAHGRSVWAYFNNDGEGNAVRNARTLTELLSSTNST